GALANRDANVKITNPGVVFPNVSRVFTVTPAINDTDCDGVVNASDCAPFDATLKHAATEVTNDTVTQVDALTISYSWDSQDATKGSATSYDVITGLIGDLHSSGNYGAATCAGNDLLDTPLGDATPVAPDQNRYWLVRAHNACNLGGGTYGDSSLASDPRDAL